ncbi:hypothetical protein HanLR1_Chr02g0070361 [Helianthus annuus]|nr:hypothetical protein HanLR1_Chr02g0070361 [Helianthus annuus]
MIRNMDQNHVITIDQELELMNNQMKESPKLLNMLAGKSSCCIYRVPRSLDEIKKEAYQPRIVSIGPYHSGNKDLEMIQEHKGRFLDYMITRTGKSLSVFMNIIVPLDNEIRESYSEYIDLVPNDLAKMMVLDGVFLIELFRKVGKLVDTHPDDPIFKVTWIVPLLMRDILRIENQIPFFVLQKLFEESKTGDRKLQSLILEFFNRAVGRQRDVLEKFENLDGKHLLDFFRQSFITNKNRNTNYPKKDVKSNNLSLKFIPSATKLIKIGVNFKANYEADSFLDVEFQNGMLLVPQINFNDFFYSFLLNCLAFEQCNFHCSKHITTYVVFMGCLINTSIDLGLLSESEIIVNCFGSDHDIEKFFKDVGKDMIMGIDDNYLSSLFMNVNKYGKDCGIYNGSRLSMPTGRWGGLNVFYYVFCAALFSNYSNSLHCFFVLRTKPISDVSGSGRS